MNTSVAQAAKALMTLSDSHFGESITLNGVSCLANVSQLKAEVDLVAGGYTQNYGLQIVINKARGIVPVIGQVVTYAGNQYRILTVESDFISFTLICDSTNK